MLWNVMLGEALVDYGYREQAAALLTRLMAATIGSLRNDHAFRTSYNPDRLEGLGDLNDVAGLAPVGLTLRCPRYPAPHTAEAALEGGHVFPWPVTLRWRAWRFGVNPEDLRDLPQWRDVRGGRGRAATDRAVGLAAKTSYNGA